MRIIDVPDHLAVRIINAIENFDSIDGQLRRLTKKVDHVLGHEEEQALDIAGLIARVEAGTSLDESIKALVEGLAEDQNPAVQALAEKLKEQGDALAAAVRANTV